MRSILLTKEQVITIAEKGGGEEPLKLTAVLADDIEVPGTIINGMEFHYDFNMDIKPEEIKEFRDPK